MADRLVRAMTYVILAVAVVWMGSKAATRLWDPDAWWHLRLGNDLIDQRSLATPHWSAFATADWVPTEPLPPPPRTRHWSVFATLPWVPTEPLPEIVSAYVERWLGLPGLAVLFCAAGLAVVLTVYVTNRVEAAVLPAAVATVFTVLASVGSMTSRPQLVSFVLLPIVLGAWLRTERDLRPAGGWCRSCGSGRCATGSGSSVSPTGSWSGSGSCSRAGPTVVRRSGCWAWPSPRGRWSPCNPAGLRVLEAPFVVRSTSQYIAEWSRTDLGLIWPLGAVVMILGTAVIWAVTRDGVTWARVLILLSACFLVWDAVRLVIVAALVVSPLFARALTTLVERSAAGRSPDSRGVSRWELRVVGGWAVLCLVVVALVAPVTSDRPGDVPTGLDAALDRLPPGTRVFNDYDLGGWMVWRHPDLEHYVDGLVTPYSVRHVDDYGRVVSQAPGWYDVVRRSGAAVALLPSDSAAAAGLKTEGLVGRGHRRRLRAARTSGGARLEDCLDADPSTWAGA